MMVVVIAVIIAPATSLVAEIIRRRRFSKKRSPLDGFFFSCASLSSWSICCIIVSVKITPISTTVPMAIAIPDKATIFASTLPNFMAIKVNKTDTGSINEISKAIRRRRKMSNTMEIVIKI